MLFRSLGEIFDATGQRDRAINEYQIALRATDDTDGAHALASKLLEGPGITDPILHRFDFDDFPRTSSIVALPAQYTPEARLAELEGTVTVAVAVASDGSLQDLNVVDSLGLGLDEAALVAAGRSPPVQSAVVRFGFFLASKQSRWHLLRVAFATPIGVSRPHFVSTNYPGGSDMSPTALDSARILAAIGRQRQALAIVTFDVDEVGNPANIRAEGATEELWGDEAVSFVRLWKFSPATKEGKPVEVPCTLDLAWTEEALTPESLVSAVEVLGTIRKPAQ